MIISKTPFRVSLFGGGTDLPEYIKISKRGKCIGFSIDKYCYIFLRKSHNLLNYKYRIAYSKQEYANSFIQIGHPPVKNAIKYYKYYTPFELLHNGDLPARTGLGSSSSFTVGICNIIRHITKKSCNPDLLAKDAIYIEQNLNKESVGYQDQILAAYGGLNVINFKENKFSVSRQNITDYKKKLLEESLLLIYTGKTRVASTIEKKKSKNMRNNYKFLDSVLNCADEFDNDLKSRSFDIKKIGEMLDYTWEKKKLLSKDVSNKKIDDLILYLKKLGIYGAKLIGAGGGGFLLIVIKEGSKNKIKNKLKNFHIIDFKISQLGSKIIAKD